MMRISELIAELEKVKAEHGDIDVATYDLEGCVDCIEADRLPGNADALREQKRFRDRERSAVVLSDEWREQSRIESHMGYTAEQSRAAYRRMVEMIKQADERGMRKWNEVHEGNS